MPLAHVPMKEHALSIEHFCTVARGGALYYNRPMLRLAEIAWVTAVYFVFFPLVPRLRGTTRAARVRMALERLGLTFVKGGQVLAALHLFNSEIQKELELLWDRAKPLPEGTVIPLVLAELGERADGMFTSFEHEPLACASIAQVHGAVLPDGREVVVKVLRPGAIL